MRRIARRQSFYAGQRARREAARILRFLAAYGAELQPWQRELVPLVFANRRAGRHLVLVTGRRLTQYGARRLVDYALRGASLALPAFWP